MSIVENILTPHQLAALNYRNHISLTANAGSGKTFVLSRRYLEIALNENIPLRNIAAITFTDKAASELYKKIATEIERRLLLNPDEASRKKLERIRRQLVSANISTIHSFCIDILREFPVEASIDANFQPIDEILSNELVELSVEETIKSAFGNPNEVEDLKYLIRVFASKRIFADELFSLIKNRKNVFDLAETVYIKSQEEIANHFYEIFTKYVSNIFVNRKDELIKNLCAINSAVINIDYKNLFASSAFSLIEKFKSNLTPVEYLTTINNLSDLICIKSGLIRTKDYLPKILKEKLSEEISFVEKSLKELKAVSIPVNHSEIENELAKFGMKLLQFFNSAGSLYEEKKKENGYLDFEDILLNTKGILKNKSVRKYLSEKFKYLMVDEYQDTNEIQYNIFLPILDDLKAGNLFIVGDEKQSIYMFRDAELEVFSETKKNIEDASGQEFLLTLPDSFRMAPEICLFANILFKNLFDEPNEFYNEVEYSELVCARGENEKGSIEILIGNGEENPENSEAELVAKKILNLVNENTLNYSDIAVLVRKRKNFSDLENSFSKHKIPYNVVGGTGFYQKQSVYDIYNYFNFLLDKNNDTAFIGILRSPFFNLSDAQIFEISRENGLKYWDKFKRYSKTHPEMTIILEALDENLNLVKSYEPTILLRKIFGETNYLSALASKQNGVQELANLDKLINLTTSFNQQSFRTTYDYLNFLKDSIEKTEDESQAFVIDESNIPEQTGSVKIMTLHQAKGLEFKVLFLFKCDEISQISSVRSKTITVGKKIGFLTKVPVKENYFSEYETAPVVNIFNHIARKKELAEIKRLFYVGITRAMDYLFISASAKNDYKFNPTSFMGLLSEGLNINYDSEEYKISSELKFLKKNGNKYSTESEKLSFSIPIIKEIDEPTTSDDKRNLYILPDNLNIDRVKDLPEEEIISATKLSIFNQCPMKYRLTYEYGFTKLMENFKNWKFQPQIIEEEFNSEDNISVEDEGNSFYRHGDIKGRIIHKILQREINKSEIQKNVELLVTEELKGFNKDFSSEKFVEKIVSDITKFYESDLFSQIFGFKNYKNEFEVYCRKEDYFLFGIIDRLIFDGNKAIIVDFKTDDIQKNEVQERFKNYLIQLKFYSYIVSRLYKSVEEFELRIIFLKYPDESLFIKIMKSETDEIKNSVGEMISKTRTGLFEKNLAHCHKCIFSVNNSCIVN